MPSRKRGVEEKDWRGEGKKKRRRNVGEFSSEFRHPRHVLTLPLKNSQENLARLRQPISFCYADKYQKFRWPCLVPYLAFTFGWSAPMCLRSIFSTPFCNNGRRITYDSFFPRRCVMSVKYIYRVLSWRIL